MNRRIFRSAIRVSPILLAILWGHAAKAVDTPTKEPTSEAEAAQLATGAMSEEYLSADFIGAAKKLEHAKRACETLACAKPLHARILCDLATVQVVGQRLLDAGKANLELALKLDPKAALDAELATPELRSLFVSLGGDPDAVREPLPVAPAATGTSAQLPPQSNEPDSDATEAPAAKAPASQSLTTSDNGAVTIDICPPDFPGCNAKDSASACTSDAQCDAGLTCTAGVCGQPKPSRNGLSLGFQQDILFLNSSENICSGTGDWTCFQSESTEGFYDQLPFEGNQNGNEIVGGPTTGTLRVLLGYDRFLGDHFGLGVRTGFAFLGGPKAPGGAAFVPWHAEGRITYWPGALPFATKGFHPFFVLGGGMAQIDAHMKVTVFDGLGGNPSARGSRREVDAWLKTGTTFAEAGIGGLYALAPGQGPTIEIKTLQMFGVSSTNAGLLVGYQVGL
ncbi:MAG: hypothetical protein SFV15_24835 [Polyangiaceae bacterium]|nr:hypothetical protein [Polyangiaceae bacterium]